MTIGRILQQECTSLPRSPVLAAALQPTKDHSFVNDIFSFSAGTQARISASLSGQRVRLGGQRTNQKYCAFMRIFTKSSAFTDVVRT